MIGKRLRSAGLAMLLLLPTQSPRTAAPAGYDTLPIEALLTHAGDLPSLGLYMLAARLFAAGRRDEAVLWF